MISIVSGEHIRHNPLHELYNGAMSAPLESPERVAIIQAAIERAGLGTITPPRAFGMAPIQAVHHADYLDHLEHAYERWTAAGGTPNGVLPETLAVRWMHRRPEHPLALPGYYAFDLSAPIMAGTFQAAVSAAHVALTGATLLLAGHRLAYALCRPPGHHAGTDMCGGYCYLNNAAIAAEYLVRHGPPFPAPPRPPTPARVAMLDIDYHHGNGTQQIFYARSDVLVVSIHADPARQYPYFSGYADERGTGAGEGYNVNIPLESGVRNERYLEALDTALARIAEFAPRYVVVSAGFDTFEGDPMTDFALTTAAYPLIGRRIAALGVPILVVQEGGYATEALGTNVTELLGGLEL
jgi:acetoin utilization deacetylase AcuC-like enzyme